MHAMPSPTTSAFTPAAPRDRVAGGLLLAIGVLTLGTAIYFLFMRPPMLPEDARFTATTLDALSPRSGDWLTIIFHTMGGFIAGFGIVLAAIGVYLLTGAPRILRGGAALALVVAFGRFLFSNILLRSDFLPVLVAMSVVALAAALALLRRK